MKDHVLLRDRSMTLIIIDWRYTCATNKSAETTKSHILRETWRNHIRHEELLNKIISQGTLVPVITRVSIIYFPLLAAGVTATRPLPRSSESGSSQMKSRH